MRKHPEVAGVYKITCLVNGKIYIGASKNIHDRFIQHRHQYTSERVTRAIKKYGKEKFELELVEEIDDEKERFQKEQLYIVKFKSYDFDIGYNRFIEKIDFPNERFNREMLLEKMEEYFMDADLLSDLLRTSRNTVDRIMNGEQHPSQLMFFRIADLFYCDFDEFLLKEANQ